MQIVQPRCFLCNGSLPDCGICSLLIVTYDYVFSSRSDARSFAQHSEALFKFSSLLRRTITVHPLILWRRYSRDRLLLVAKTFLQTSCKLLRKREFSRGKLWPHRRCCVAVTGVALKVARVFRYVLQFVLWKECIFTKNTVFEESRYGLLT